MNLLLIVFHFFSSSSSSLIIVCNNLILIIKYYILEEFKNAYSDTIPIYVWADDYVYNKFRILGTIPLDL